MKIGLSGGTMLEPPEEPDPDFPELWPANGPDTFTFEERELLRRHFAFYRALETGQRSPSSVAQKHFAAVCEGRVKAETTHEVAYAKYMRRRRKPEPPP